MSNNHQACASLEDDLIREIYKLKKVIAVYRKMAIAAGMHALMLDNIEEEAYKS